MWYARWWFWLALFITIGGVILLRKKLGAVGTLTAAQITALASQAGFQGDDLTTAVAIALAESNGDPLTLGDQGIAAPGTASYGLWQINSYWHPEFGPDFTTLYDPQRNANAAYSVYLGSSSFQPWSTFKNGAYRAYLPIAQQSVQSA